MSNSDSKELGLFFGGVSSLLLVIVGVICLFAYGCPQYKVYKQGQVGAAKLKEAESSRQIAVLEAQAKFESAKMLSDAEVQRAKGAAEAAKIINEVLQKNPLYLTYLWIQVLCDKDNNVIYVPTEANLPVLEAGRFKNLVSNKEAK